MAGIDHIFLDPIPGYIPAGSHLHILWIFLINLCLFSLFAILVFCAAGEKERVFSIKMVPYALVTVALGIPIDIFYLRISEKLFVSAHEKIFWSAPEASRVFYETLQNGSASLLHGFSFRCFILPSIVAFALLFAVQIALMRLAFFRGLRSEKAILMSAGIAVLTLPTWGALMLVNA